MPRGSGHPWESSMEAHRWPRFRFFVLSLPGVLLMQTGLRMTDKVDAAKAAALLLPMAALAAAGLGAGHAWKASGASMSHRSKAWRTQESGGAGLIWALACLHQHHRHARRLRHGNRADAAGGGDL